MVLLLAKNSKAGCPFRSNFLKQVVIEIQKMEHPRQKFLKYPSENKTYVSFRTIVLKLIFKAELFSQTIFTIEI